MAFAKCLNCGWEHPAFCTADEHPLVGLEKLQEGFKLAVLNDDARRVALDESDLTAGLKLEGEDPIDCDIRMLVVATLGRMADTVSQIIWFTQDDYHFAQDKTCPCCMSDRLAVCDA